MRETDSTINGEIENIKHQKPDIPSLSGNDGGIDSIKIGDVVYTREEAINDLRALGKSFPERRITRDFYRRHANIPESAWSGVFGGFSEFLRAAGMELSRYQNKIKLKVAQHASLDHLREVSEERKNYGNLYLRNNKKRFKTMIACSDLHDIECDDFYLRVLIDTIKTVQPEVICIAGDLFDLPEFSKFNVDPREWDTVGRIKAGLKIIERIREVAPDSQIDCLEGNHEYRLVKHLMESSPATASLLADLHGFDLRKLLKLDEYEVNYIASGDLCTFTERNAKQETQKNYKIYWNSVLAHHFPHGREKGLPGFNGHHHQHVVWSEYNALIGSYEWHQMGGGHKRNASYCDGSKWNSGFLITNVDTQTRDVVFDYTTVGTSLSISGGTWYYRNEDEYYPELREELRNKGVSIR